MPRLPTLAILLVLFTGAAALSLPQAIAQESATEVAVSGVVVDGDGNPLEGVDVSGSSWNEAGSSSDDHAVTDEDGAFTLHLLPGKAYVNAWYREWNRGQSLEILLTSDGEDDLELEIVAPPPRDATVTGRVFGSDGKPIEGARVTIGQGCCYYGYGETKPLVREAEPAPATDADAAAPEESTAASGDGTSGSAGMSSEPARIAPDYCCYDYDYRETLTDAEGRYEFQTYGGPRAVTAMARGHAQTTVQVDAIAGETVELDIQLEKVPDATAVLAGRVLDAKTGLPVPNAYVSLSNLEWSRWNSTTTGKDGSFRFQTIPGWVQISVNAQTWTIDAVAVEEGVSTDGADAVLTRPGSISSPAYKSLAQSFELADGETERDFRIVPKDAPTIVLTGYVVDPQTKKAVPNAWLNIWNQDTGDWGSAQTDKDGSYKILVRPGYHQVSAYAEGYLSATDMVDVEDGEAAVRFDLDMPKGVAKYAPCDDCYQPYPVAERSYAPPAAGDVDYAADDADGGSGAQLMSATSAEESAKNAPMGFASGEPGDDGTRAASYVGEGGGLGPYDPDATDAAGSAQNPVPGLSLLVLLGAAALVAVAANRRK